MHTHVHMHTHVAHVVMCALIMLGRPASGELHLTGARRCARSRPWRTAHSSCGTTMPGGWGALPWLCASTIHCLHHPLQHGHCFCACIPACCRVEPDWARLGAALARSKSKSSRQHQHQQQPVDASENNNNSAFTFGHEEECSRADAQAAGGGGATCGTSGTSAGSSSGGRARPRSARAARGSGAGAAWPSHGSGHSRATPRAQRQAIVAVPWAAPGRGEHSAPSPSLGSEEGSPRPEGRIKRFPYVLYVAMEPVPGACTLVTLLQMRVRCWCTVCQCILLATRLLALPPSSRVPASARLSCTPFHPSGVTLDVWLRNRNQAVTSPPRHASHGQHSRSGSTGGGMFHAVEQSIFCQILMGLSHIHAAGLLHRDRESLARLFLEL